MSDRPANDRARPQYGEYASPDERIAAGGLPLEPAQPAKPVAPPTSRAMATDATKGTPRTWDPIITVMLLAFGAYTVVTSIPVFLDLATTLRAVFEEAGYGAYTSDDLAGSIGVAIVVVQSVLYLATLLLTIWRLRAKKVAFFFPLVGGVLWTVIVFGLLAAAMAADPALMQAVTSGS